MTLRAYLDAACTMEVGGTPEVGSAYAGFDLQLGLSADSVLYFRDDAGKRTPSAVTVYPVTAHGTISYPSDITVSATASNYQPAATGANIGIVGGTTAVPCHFMQTVGRPEAMRPFYVRAVYGGASIDLPAFSASPSVGSIGSTSITATATGNSVVTAMKYLVLPAASAAPAIGDFSLTFTSGMSITGLTASTSYKLYVALWDADGFYTISSAVAFQTNVAGAALSFSAQPSASSATSQGFTVGYSLNDSGSGVGVTHWLSTDGGSNFSQVSPGGSYPNYTYAVTGKTSGTYSVQVKVISGATTVLSGVVSMSTGTLGNVTGFTATAGDLANALAWTKPTGADHVSIEWGTDGSTFGNTIADQTGTTYSHTGLSLGTVYYYRVKAHDSAGNVSASYATTNAQPYILNDFSTDALETSWITTSKSGTATASVTGGLLVLDSTPGGSGGTDAAAYVVSGAKLDLARSEVFEVKVRCDTIHAGENVLGLVFSNKATAPAVGHSVNDGLNSGFRCFTKFAEIGKKFIASVYNNGTSDYYWDPVTAQWTTSPTEANLTTFTAGTSYIFVMEHDTTQFRFIVKSAAGATIYTTGYVPFTSLGSPRSDLWAWGGEVYTNGYYDKMSVSYIKRT